MKKVSIILALSITPMMALPFVTIEAGASVGESFHKVANLDFSNKRFSYGLYSRVLFDLKLIELGLYAKYSILDSLGTNRTDNLMYLYTNGYERNHNLQYGALLGLNIPVVKPYAGFGYSNYFQSPYADGWEVQYGVRFVIPVLPLSLGVDISQPLDKRNPLIINANLGIKF